MVTSLRWFNGRCFSIALRQKKPRLVPLYQQTRCRQASSKWHASHGAGTDLSPSRALSSREGWERPGPVWTVRREPVRPVRHCRVLPPGRSADSTAYIHARSTPASNRVTRPASRGRPPSVPAIPQTAGRNRRQTMCRRKTAIAVVVKNRRYDQAYGLGLPTHRGATKIPAEQLHRLRRHDARSLRWTHCADQTPEPRSA